MNSKLSMILFVLILGSVLTTALVAVDQLTKEPIARNKAVKLQKGILSSLSIEFGQDDIDKKFSSNIEIIERQGFELVKFYRCQTSGDIAFEISGTGVQGPIHGTIALSPDLEEIRGLSIVEQKETPGLGGRIVESEFLNQFKGKKVSSGLAILSPGKAAADNEVDGLTGATLTCNALEILLNSEIKKYVVMFRESK